MIRRAIIRAAGMCWFAILFPVASMGYATGQPQSITPDPIPYVAPSRSFDIIHTSLDLDIDVRGKCISGLVTHRLKALRNGLEEIYINCVSLTVDSVFIDGYLAAFDYPVPGSYETSWMDFVEPRQPTDLLVIHSKTPIGAGRLLEITIFYHGAPSQGLYFIAPERGIPEKRYEVWSQGEGEDNRYWIPCFDYPNDKATFKGTFRVDKEYYVLSNGVLESERDLGGRKEFRYRLDSPQVSYLIMIAAGRYEIFEDQWKDVQIQYLVPPGTGRVTVERAFGLTPDMIDFFSRKIGIDYPFRKYAQVVVQNFIYGGMENTTATVLAEKALYDQRASLTRDSQGLIAHELAHQWWGDMVTCREWTHLWLNEGFATYFAALYNAYHRGEDEFIYQMDSIHKRVIEREKNDPRPLVVDFFNRRDKRNSNNIYIKGASVLHMMRFLLGDSLFFATIRAYATKHKFGLVDTHDLSLAVKETTGENLDWFFEQWVYLSGYPEITVTTSWDNERRTLKLGVSQTQKQEKLTPLFRLPLDIEFTCREGKETYRITVDKRSQDFYFRLPSKPLLVIFDKGDWTLKAVRFEKTTEELLYQMRHGATIERVRAARELSKKGGDRRAIEALREVLLGPGFWGIRREAALSLGQIKNAASREALLEGLRASEARVRLACCEALSHWKKDEEVAAELLVRFRKDPSYDVCSEALRSLVRIRSGRAYKACLGALRRSSYQDIIRVAGLRGLSDLRDPKALPAIRDLASPGNPRTYRHQAILSYATLAKRLKSEAAREKASLLMEEMLDDWYFKTRITVIEALEILGEKEAIESLRSAARTDPVEFVRKRAMGAANKIETGAAEKEGKDALETELRTLKERIEELEKSLKTLRERFPERGAKDR